MNLYIKQKVFSFGAKYNVYDANQNVIYTIWGEVFTLGYKLHMSDSQGREIVFIKQKLLTFLPKFEIYVENQLFATINKEFTFLNDKFNIESKLGNFTIDGDFFSHEYKIFCNGSLFGEVSKEWFTWGDVYSLNINGENNSHFFVALVIAIDSVLAMRRNNN